MAVETFDIIVVGGGIAGASAAADLARTHRVVVLEREEFPGYHSTGRSAALFSEIYGNGVVRALSRASRNFFYAPPDGFTPNALVKPRSSLYIADGEQLRSLENFAAEGDIAGAIRRMTREAALAACPILRPDYVSAALMEDDAADVDVNALHMGYLREFRNLGGTIAVNEDAQSFRYVSNQWHVETRDHAFRAPIVVNAAGAWADDVALKAGTRPLQIQPCRRTAVLVELPGGFNSNAWPAVVDIDEAFYLKPDAGLLLISPADETPIAPCDVQPEELDIAIAIDRVERATTLKINTVRKRWAGLRSFAPDRSPIIGFDAHLRGFFWLAGQGGYGIQTAPAAARLAGSLARGETPAAEFANIVDQLSPQRFRTKAGIRSLA